MKHLILLGCILFISQSCNQKQKNVQDNPVKDTKKLVLKVHIWQGYVEPWVKDFKKYILEKKNIDVDVQITHTTGLESFIDAIENKGVHLITPSIDLIQSLYRRNLIQPIYANRIKNLNQIFPQIIESEKDFAIINNKTYAIPFVFGAYALAYNQNKMMTPKSYAVLWDTKYSKRVSITGDYGVYNIYMTALYLKLPVKDLFHLNEKQLSLVQKKLTELCQNQVLSFWGDGLRDEDYGKIDVGTDWGIGISRYTKKGGKWAMTIPDEGALVWIDNWLLTKNADTKEKIDLAHDFIEYALRPENTALAGKAAECSPGNIFSSRYLTPEEIIKFHLNNPKFFKTFILNQPLSEEFEKKYNEIWLKIRGK